MALPPGTLPDEYLGQFGAMLRVLKLLNPSRTYNSVTVQALRRDSATLTVAQAVQQLFDGKTNIHVVAKVIPQRTATELNRLSVKNRKLALTEDVQLGELASGLSLAVNQIRLGENYNALEKEKCTYYRKVLKRGTNNLKHARQFDALYHKVGLKFLACLVFGYKGGNRSAPNKKLIAGLYNLKEKHATTALSLLLAFLGDARITALPRQRHFILRVLKGDVAVGTTMDSSWWEVFMDGEAEMTGCWGPVVAYMENFLSVERLAAKNAEVGTPAVTTTALAVRTPSGMVVDKNGWGWQDSVHKLIANPEKRVPENKRVRYQDTDGSADDSQGGEEWGGVERRETQEQGGGNGAAVTDVVAAGVGEMVEVDTVANADVVVVDPTNAIGDTAIDDTVIDDDQELRTALMLLSKLKRKHNDEMIQAEARVDAAFAKRPRLTSS